MKVLDAIDVQPYKDSGPTADDCVRMQVDAPFEMQELARRIMWGQKGKLILARVDDSEPGP